MHSGCLYRACEIGRVSRIPYCACERLEYGRQAVVRGPQPRIPFVYLP
jgi:hypothetical protein